MYVFHFASLQFISNCCSSGSCLSTLPTNTGGKITVVSTKANHFCTVLKRSKSLQSFRMVFSAFQLLLSSALAKTLHASPKALTSTRISAPFKPRAEWKRTRGHKRWQNRFDVEMENRNSDNVKCIKMFQKKTNNSLNKRMNCASNLQDFQHNLGQVRPVKRVKPTLSHQAD